MTYAQHAGPNETPPAAASPVREGEIFQLGWSYDSQQDYITLRALKDFDLREISYRLITGYPPRTTVRQHLDHLSQTLLREGYASTEVSLLSFTFHAGEDGAVEDLATSHFYNAQRR